MKRDESRIKEIQERVSAENIQFIQLWFTDILGSLKSFTISHKELERALQEGMGFDGSSIEGFARIYESDLLAVPDLDTFVIMPWKYLGMPVARLFCDVYTPEGKLYSSDPRSVLKRNLENMRSMGFDSFMVGPELEYFYFKTDKAPEMIDSGAYFDAVPVDESHDLRRETMLMLDQCGIDTEYSHHEVAPSQHEIDLRFSHALPMADNVITYKTVAKQVAAAHGCYASFMPKPVAGINGSGMHVHQSLFKGDVNTFYDAKDAAYLSPTAKHYVAGILHHAREICAVTNQWINSYKRLVPGYEAPVYIAWANSNRSALVRVPRVKKGKPNSVRIECRFPDPACNPYLAFSVMLAAGLDGIKKKMPLGKPVEADIFEMDEIERRARTIDTLPGSLIEALETLEQSKLVREALGDAVFEKFIANKRIEWDQYRVQVTDYEIKKYLPML